MGTQDPSYRRIDSQYPERRQPYIHLPSPLPADVLHANDPALSALYPSTGVIDAISMIAICLRRPEHVPRAFQIFNHLLVDVKANGKRIPEAEIWGRVVEGVASLGQEKTDDKAYQNWRSRAEVLVGKWETTNQRPKGTACLDNDGLKIYQGWLSGLIK